MVDVPRFFALISRIRQEIALIGPDGGVLASTVSPKVQAVFPKGALQKRIKVGLQVSHRFHFCIHNCQHLHSTPKG